MEGARQQADGDVVLADSAVEGFVVVDCLDCGGLLKPDVVFFGEVVPPARVAASFALVERARALVVLGSSLTVMSGHRFVLRAAALGVPVAIVNQGQTRGDRHATLTIDQPLGEALGELTDWLVTPPASVSVRPGQSSAIVAGSSHGMMPSA